MKNASDDEDASEGTGSSSLITFRAKVEKGALTAGPSPGT